MTVQEDTESLIFEVVTAVVSIVVSWDATPCGLADYQRFGGLYRLHLQDSHSDPDDGGSMFLRNVGNLQDHAASHPRRRRSTDPVCVLSHLFRFIHVFVFW
jgi:hypothetical protein